MDDDINVSEFNEMQFKMIRIHKLQDQINELWNNPFGSVYGFNYNYEVLFSVIESLYAEVYSKCTKEEKKKAKQRFENVETILEKKPAFEKSKHPSSRRQEFNKDNWKVLKKKLKRLNLYTRQLLENHGFSPNKDFDMMGL